MCEYVSVSMSVNMRTDSLCCLSCSFILINSVSFLIASAL